MFELPHCCVSCNICRESGAIICPTILLVNSPMRVVVIGGSGHLGSYLVPRLVEAGHAVTCVARGGRKPWHEHSTWNEVQKVEVDRAAEESRGAFGGVITTGLPAMALTGLDFHQLDSFRKVSSAHLEFPSPKLCLARYPAYRQIHRDKLRQYLLEYVVARR